MKIAIRIIKSRKWSKRSYQKLVILFKERREGCTKFLYVSIYVTSASYHLHELLPIRSKLHNYLWGQMFGASQMRIQLTTMMEKQITEKHKTREQW